MSQAEIVSTSIRVLFCALSAALLILIFMLIRKRKIDLQHALIWVFLGAGGVVFAIFPSVLFAVGRMLGFQLPANAALSISVFILAFISFLQMVALGKTQKDLRALTQKVAKDNAERATKSSLKI